MCVHSLNTCTASNCFVTQSSHLDCRKGKLWAIYIVKVLPLISVVHCRRPLLNTLYSHGISLAKGACFI